MWSVTVPYISNYSHPNLKSIIHVFLSLVVAGTCGSVFHVPVACLYVQDM